MESPFKIFVDRSALADLAACPRRFWWAREWGKGMVLGPVGGVKNVQTIPVGGAFENIEGVLITQDYKVHPGGLSPARKSVYLVLGGCVHTGMNYLMSILMTLEADRKPLHVNDTVSYGPGGLWHTAVMKAVDQALAEFDQAMAAGGISVPDAKTPPQVDWKLREARALIEGLVMVAGFRLVPNLIERFRVVEVEREKRFKLTQLWAPMCEVWFESRADNLWEERETGDLYVNSWKTSADYGRMESEQFRRDVQGLSEAIAIEQDRSHNPTVVRKEFGGEPIVGTPFETNKWVNLSLPRIQGIQMAFLLKGRKYAADRLGLGEGLKIHYSPLTRGWKREVHGILPGDDLSEWCWSYEVPKVSKAGDAYMGKLGKDWVPVAVFDEYPGGTRQWVLDLMAGKWQPEAGDPFGAITVVPEPWSRSDREMEDWLEQTRAIVEDILPKGELVRAAFAKGDWQEARSLLNRYFPQDRKSCSNFYGGRCFADEICFGPDEVGQDPLGHDYVLRQPHHPGAVDDEV